MNFKPTKKLSTGFSLIELMIAVVIVGILAAVAFPSYVSHVTESKRSDGQISLLETAQTLERCFTEYNAYNNANCTFPALSRAQHYDIARTVSTPTTFTLQATPRASQTDPLCEALTLTHTGVKGESGSGTLDDCW